MNGRTVHALGTLKHDLLQPPQTHPTRDFCRGGPSWVAMYLKQSSIGESGMISLTGHYVLT